MFLVRSVYFNLRNILPKSGTFLPGHPVYVCKISYVVYRAHYVIKSADFVVLTDALVTLMLTHEDTECKQYVCTGALGMDTNVGSYWQPHWKLLHPLCSWSGHWPGSVPLIH